MPGNPFYRTKDWHRIRTKVLFRDHFRCVFCRKDVKEKGKARVDHIETLKSRPDLGLEMSNLRTLCTSCDAMRHREKAAHFHGGKIKDITETGPDGMPVDPNHAWNQQ